MSDYILIFSSSEVSSLEKMINFVVENLGEELSIRTGFNIEEYYELKKKIKDNNSKQEYFNEEEVIMVNQILNEVCHGIYTPDFEQQFGLAIRDAETMLESIDRIIASDIGNSGLL